MIIMIIQTIILLLLLIIVIIIIMIIMYDTIISHNMIYYICHLLHVLRHLRAEP